MLTKVLMIEGRGFLAMMSPALAVALAAAVATAIFGALVLARRMGARGHGADCRGLRCEHCNERMVGVMESRCPECGQPLSMSALHRALGEAEESGADRKGGE